MLDWFLFHKKRNKRINVNISLALGIHIIKCGMENDNKYCYCDSFVRFMQLVLPFHFEYSSRCYCGNAKYAHNQSLNKTVKKGMQHTSSKSKYSRIKMKNQIEWSKKKNNNFENCVYVCVFGSDGKREEREEIYIEINKIRWTTCKREIVDENIYKLFAEKKKRRRNPN